MKLELGIEYVTRGGHAVRLYALDGEGDWPVHGAILTPCRWAATTWKADGQHGQRQSGLDLLPKPRVRTGWLNVWKTYSQCGFNPVGTFPTKEEADKFASKSLQRLACVRVTFTEGEGL